jgi:predicted amino acid-binding ACT domain protein
MSNNSPKSTAQHHTERVQLAIQAFNEKMSEKIIDEMAVVHIIGAFSAGKSRLVRELLLPHKTVQALLPVSSRERQTALPLEITYAETSRLVRIDAVKKETVLSAFPKREEQQRFDPSSHYLRLELPEPALLLGNISLISAEEGMKRVVLKDMPGWSSGDSFVAENPLANGLIGSDNISLVYVANANRVDSQDDLTRLLAIFTAVETGDAYFYNGFSLVVVVTCCDDKSEHEAIKQRVSERLQTLAEKVDVELQLTVLCVEFGKESERLDHQAFVNDFWQAIFAPIAEQKQTSTASDWATRIQHWQTDWHLQDKLAQSLRIIESIQPFVEQFKKQDQFIANMNNTRLLGLSKQERCEKVHSVWLKQVGQWQADTQHLQLTNDHPLAQWWQDYWLTQLHNLIKPVELLLQHMETAIQQLPIEVPDLQQYFHHRLENSYQNALTIEQSYFHCVCDAIEPILHDNNQAKLVATLLSLSLLDAKYADYYHSLKTA